MQHRRLQAHCLSLNMMFGSFLHGYETADVQLVEFTLNLKQTEVISESRRLLGFAAIERLNQGSYPTGASIGLGTS